MRNLLLLASTFIAGSTFADGFHGEAEIANGKEWRAYALSNQYSATINLNYTQGPFDIKLESLSTPYEASWTSATQLNLHTTYSGSFSPEIRYTAGVTHYTYPNGLADSWNEFNISLAYSDFSLHIDYANESDFYDNAEKSTHIALTYEGNFKSIDLKLTAGNVKFDTVNFAKTYYQLEIEHNIRPNLVLHAIKGRWSADDYNDYNGGYTNLGLKTSF